MALIQDLWGEEGLFGWSGNELQIVAERAFRNFVIDRPTTNDGYAWFWGIQILNRSGAIAILFPWCQDWKKNDRTQSDRHIAVYTRGSIGEKKVRRLLYRLYEAMEHRLEERAREQEEAEERRGEEAEQYSL
ncbi:MAG TPA: hypothetical protein VI432_02590 [Candidatus Paceibacterota bacterium]